MFQDSCDEVLDCRVGSTYRELHACTIGEMISLDVVWHTVWIFWKWCRCGLCSVIADEAVSYFAAGNVAYDDPLSVTASHGPSATENAIYTRGADCYG